MQLLASYLQAVAACLPKSQRADITAELHDTLLSHLEQRQAQLGRELTLPELEALLHSYGHPLSVAAQYWPDRPFIGPALRGLYGFSLGLGLVIVVLTALGLGIHALAVHAPGMQVLAIVCKALWMGAVEVVGVTTIVIFLLDRSGYDRWLLKYTMTWRPRDLPRPAKPPQPIPVRRALIFDLVVLALLAVWLSGIVNLAPLLDRLYALVHLQPGAIWSEIRQAVLLGLLVVAVLQTSVHVLALARPQQRRTQLALGIGTRVASLAVLFILWRAWPWWKLFDIPAAVAPSAELGIQIGLGIAFGIVALVSAVALIWEARLLLGSPAAGGRF